MASGIRLRPTRGADLAFVTSLERSPENVEFIGQWTDEEHLAAIERRERREHWIIERNGEPAGYLIAYDARAAGAGIYVKRILVADKERGTGGEALRQFIEDARRRDGADRLWLIVFEKNARAQHVYRKLGFARFDPDEDERKRCDEGGEPPMPECFRMTLAL